MDDTLIEFNNVTKKFVVNPTINLRHLIFGKKETPVISFGAKNLSLKVKRGEVVGLYGPNGSGKSTILRLAAKILEPDSGSITVNGKVASVIELGSGLHHELTGSENIDLYGAILGLSKNEIAQKRKEIITFSGLSNYLKIPIKHYSTGMRAKLATAIAIYSDADILLMDEAISVGDADFRIKFMREVLRVKNKKATIFTTHDMGLLNYLSDRVILLNHGEDKSSEFELSVWSAKLLPFGQRFKGKVASNSMYPILKKGQKFSIERVRFSSLKVNDIVVFKPEKIPEAIIHRVYEIFKKGKNSYALTKGDASINIDGWKVTEKELMGRVII